MSRSTLDLTAGDRVEVTAGLKQRSSRHPGSREGFGELGVALWRVALESRGVRVVREE